MTAAARADAKENSIAGLKPTKQAVIASYTRDHRAPTAALLKSPCRKVAADSLTPSESRNFGPGTRLLVEALMASRISVEGS